MRKYIALWESNFYGTYIEEIEFYSDHRANSKANFADAMKEIKRRYERGISNSAVILRTYLAND